MSNNELEFCPLINALCIGEPCIRFAWQYGGPIKADNQYSIRYGFCGWAGKRNGYLEDVKP
jgi:hypothetical protein